MVFSEHAEAQAPGRPHEGRPHAQRTCAATRNREWYAEPENAETRRDYRRNKYAERPEPPKANSRSYRANNRDKVKEANNRWRSNLRREVVNAYGGHCECCGESEIRFLTLDHVNGDGAAHRRQINARNSWHKVYQWAKENGFPPTLRVLCWNCNNASWRNNGICPHREANALNVAIQKAA